MADEKGITGSPLVNILCTTKILEQMKNCICKIKIKGATGTGFFCKVQIDENNIIKFLMTNYHVIDEEYINENKEIDLTLNDDNEGKIIDLNIKRIIYYNKEYDTTLIELKEEDKIKEYLELDDNLFKDNENALYKEKSIYILQYPKSEDACCVSYGSINQIDKKYDIKHICSTDNGSSGSPILNLKNNKVIGIHKKGAIINFNFNIGTLLKYPLNDFFKKYNSNNNKNIITGEIYIKNMKINKSIRGINSFENKNVLENEIKIENNKEINDINIKNEEIKIENKEIKLGEVEYNEIKIENNKEINNINIKNEEIKIENKNKEIKLNKVENNEIKIEDNDNKEIKFDDNKKENNGKN